MAASLKPFGAALIALLCAVECTTSIPHDWNLRENVDMWEEKLVDRFADLQVHLSSLNS